MKSLILLSGTLLLGVIAEAEESAFCKRNPDARVCKSAYDVRREEKAKLDDECSLRPNTERCKSVEEAKRVRKERRERRKR